MSRDEAYLNAMLRELGAAYYQTLHGEGRHRMWHGQLMPLPMPRAAATWPPSRGAPASVVMLAISGRRP